MEVHVYKMQYEMSKCCIIKLQTQTDVYKTSMAHETPRTSVILFLTLDGQLRIPSPNVLK